ncbi:WhiB family transcriptional regulator [Candidatus Protofrankia californiensis]|uniref:WhiB family transcriptional regulator n=1 Tax=Candidatus Protofrankia californiensis TaxID=1839754 RepID=UPI0013EBDE6B|nr:WhiB family transcriptional regulator [Candidatus Protofrankia californiensis]
MTASVRTLARTRGPGRAPEYRESLADRLDYIQTLPTEPAELFDMVDSRTRPCVENPTVFFGSDRGDSVRAARMCGPCPVLDECLALALALPEPPDGIWGGLTKKQRRHVHDIASRQREVREARLREQNRTQWEQREKLRRRREALNDPGPTLALIFDEVATVTARGIAEAIERLTADGRLLPGMRMPGCVELSSALAVHSAMVRRSYRLLASAGVLDVAQGRDTRVTARRRKTSVASGEVSI